MTTAIILSAGQGSRLLPLTADRPKCLIEVGGKTIIDHQLDALAEAGIERVVVVGGYRADQLEAHLVRRDAGIEFRLNPFWALSSSIGSVWAARDALGDDFVLLNGDTVYAPALIRTGLAGIAQGVSLFVEPLIDPMHDDMLVTVEGGRIQAVAKTLDPAQATHRSLGILAAHDDGGCYHRMLGAIIARTEGPHSFHHQIVHELAQMRPVHPIVVANGGWVEIDRPEDIANWRS